MKNEWRFKSQLPQPWGLSTDGWMDRLGIREADRRHYAHLSEAELRALEGLRGLLVHYGQTDLLREGATTSSLMKRFCEDIDSSWLKKGKGRAVDFRHAFQVLARYAEYREWAQSFPGKKPVIDLVLPYFIKGFGTGCNGPGFVRIEFEVSDPQVGKFQNVRWTKARCVITELKFIDNVQWNALHFGKHPFEFLDPERTIRYFTYRMGGESDRLGLVSYMSKFLRQVASKGDGFRINCVEHQIDAYWDLPNQKQIGEFFQAFASLYFHHRVPRKKWQLQLEVGEDLSINPFSRFLEHSPFGRFFESWMSGDCMR